MYVLLVGTIVLGLGTTVLGNPALHRLPQPRPATGHPPHPSWLGTGQIGQPAGYRWSTNGCGTPIRPSLQVKYVVVPLEALSV
jgi:hypothetical protein